MEKDKSVGIFVYCNQTDEIVPTSGGTLFHIADLCLWGKKGYSIFRISLKDRRRKITREIATDLIRDYELMNDQAFCEMVSLKEFI